MTNKKSKVFVKNETNDCSCIIAHLEHKDKYFPIIYFIFNCSFTSRVVESIVFIRSM